MFQILVTKLYELVTFIFLFRCIPVGTLDKQVNSKALTCKLNIKYFIVSISIISSLVTSWSATIFDKLLKILISVQMGLPVFFFIWAT